MSSIQDPAEQAYLEAKLAAEVRYQRRLAEIIHLRGGNQVRAAAKKAADERLREEYRDAELVGLFHGNPVIDSAEAALRHFGDLDRDTAASVLPTWAHYDQLTQREAAAVLARFRRGEPRGDSGGWLSGPCTTGPSIDDDDFDATCGPVPPRTDPFYNSRFPGGAQ